MEIRTRFVVSSLLLIVVSLFILSGCKSKPPDAPSDNPPTASISSPAANEVVRGTDTIFVNATDDLAVTKVELYINGSLSSTDNAEPWRFIWDTETSTDGSYTLLVKAYDSGGQIGTSPSVSVTVKNAFPVTFINSTYTSMSITVLSVTRTVQSGDSTTFTYTINPRSLVFNASTSGTTSSGAQIGLMLVWGGSGSPIDVSGLTYYRARLVVGSDKFFMYMQNTGRTTLGPVYVNYGLTDQTLDNIAIPGDGVTYRIGYYKAYTNTTVRAYWSSPYTTTYSSWTPVFPGTINQSVTLLNTLPPPMIGTANFGQSPDVPIHGVLLQVPVASNTKAPRIPQDNAVLAFPHD